MPCPSGQATEVSWWVVMLTLWGGAQSWYLMNFDSLIPVFWGLWTSRKALGLIMEVTFEYEDFSRTTQKVGLEGGWMDGSLYKGLWFYGSRLMISSWTRFESAFSWHRFLNAAPWTGTSLP